MKNLSRNNIFSIKSHIDIINKPFSYIKLDLPNF